VRPQERPHSVSLLSAALRGEMVVPPRAESACEAPPDAAAPHAADRLDTPQADPSLWQATVNSGLGAPASPTKGRRVPWVVVMLGTVAVGLAVAVAAGLMRDRQPPSTGASRMPAPSLPAGSVGRTPEDTGASPVAQGTTRPSQPTSPREACGNRHFIALAMCMQRQCDTPRFRQHAQCQRLRAEEARRDSRNLH
jgi:hypothetical protein